MSILNKNSRKRWQSLFEDTMNAATFAEANEHETARSFINGEQSSQETVVLVVDGNEVNRRTLDYATNLCKNMDCFLTILQVNGPDSNGTFSNLKDQMLKFLDIPWNFIGTEGPISKAVSRFLKQQSQVVSVVLEDQQGTKTHARRRSPWWKKLYCPVVIV